MIIRNLPTKAQIVIVGMVLSLVITMVFTFKTVQGWEYEIPVDPFEEVSAVLNTPFPSLSPSPEVAATTTLSPTAEVMLLPQISSPEATDLIPVSGFFDAILKEVIHIENGEATLIKIRAAAEIEGQFYAELVTSLSKWEYICTIYEYNPIYLFCFGERLPDRSQAAIFVFQQTNQDGEAVLVYATDFVVPVLFTPTK